MKRRQVWRYYCEFCKKANCSGASIKKHERGCTANPNRVCSMHKYVSSPQVTDAETVAEYMNDIESLREITGGCPACMLAAVRRFPPDGERPYLEFDYTEESRVFWNAVNENGANEEGRRRQHRVSLSDLTRLRSPIRGVEISSIIVDEVQPFPPPIRRPRRIIQPQKRKARVSPGL